MLFAGVGVALVFQGAEGADQFGAGLRGLDYGVDVAALGGYIGVGEAFAEVSDFFLRRFSRSDSATRSSSRL